jgi:hypothetical protein
MKTFKHSALLFFVSFCVLSSCNKGDTNVAKHGLQKITYTDGVSSNNGIPLYKNWSVFMNSLNRVNTPHKLNEFENRYSFRSLLGEYIKSVNNKDYNESSSLIYKDGDNVRLELSNYGFAALVNLDGLAIIGAHLYKFKDDHNFNIPIVGLQVDQAIQILNSPNPGQTDSRVKLSIFEEHPVQQKNQTENSGNIQASGSWDQGGYTTFHMSPNLSWGTYTIHDYECQSGLVYDEDSRGYVCADQVVYMGVHTDAVFIASNTITRRNCFLGCSTQFAEDPWILSNELDGSFNYQFEGIQTSKAFSVTSLNYSLFTELFRESRSGDSINFDVYGGSATFICKLKSDYGYLGYFGVQISF